MEKLNNTFCAFFLGLSLFVTTASQAQSHLVPAVDRVTIFTNGAQVNRHQTVTVPAGRHTFSFTGLSPYLDISTLQVRAGGPVTILGVSHRFAHPDSLMLTGKVRQEAARLKSARQKVDELKAQRKVLLSQLDMVKTNCSVASRTVATPLEGIKQLNQYYYDEMMAVNKRIIALDNDEALANEVLSRQQARYDSVAGIKMKRFTVVDVTVESRRTAQTDFSFSYYLGGASWMPSYDIRSTKSDGPILLTYKASITQNTNEDWVNVPVTLSSANPNRSNVVPDLRTYWLDYGQPAPVYEFGVDNNRVSGVVRSDDGEPVIGASVRVAGTTIGTVTDVDGRYQLTLPTGNRKLEVAYIGYETEQKEANGSTLNFTLKEDGRSLQEVVVMGYGGKRKRALKEMEKADEPVAEVVSDMQAGVEVEDDNALEVKSAAAKFGYEYAIEQPLTIHSDNKPVSCQIKKYELPATYSYKVVPKIDKDAFLMADVTGWRSLNLTEGEATVYFDNSYVGTTIFTPDQQSDTLHLSMGRDNGIHVERKLIKADTSHKFLGGSQSQTKDWQISIRNSRNERVSLRVYDQIPVSRNSDITVTPTELGNGEYDSKTGEVMWTLSLAPGEQKVISLAYQVKYPRSRSLDVE
ncbi:MAG: mucoidy inhibitor MuiA family protein [Prevotella sp.]|nr:mucoidy inhibitor MuiA family protein [Prevotella sp.]